MMSKPELILPVGTQVVTRVVVEVSAGDRRPRGAVGAIVATPVEGDGVYRVRFPDGAETSLRRSEVGVRRHDADVTVGALEGDGGTVDLRAFVIYRCVVGSRAFGLDEPGSDTDRRGIFLPPASLHWSLAGVPELLEDEARQEAYWEIERFLRFALKANPNVLECLYSPLVEEASPLAEELLGMRSVFLSKLLYKTYNGYVMSQFKNLEADLRNQGRLKWKHVMHLVRLLLAGGAALREGALPVHVGEHRERLLAIRRGEVAWEEVDAWRLRLHRELDAAYERTRLPERPDYQRADEFLIRARRSAVDV